MWWTRSMKRRPRALRPKTDGFDPRVLLSGYSPTAIEQLYLEELDERAARPGWFRRFARSGSSSVAPAQPLAMSPLLVESARLHSEDMIAENYFSHTALDGSGPGQQDQATGFPVLAGLRASSTTRNPPWPHRAFPRISRRWTPNSASPT